MGSEAGRWTSFVRLAVCLLVSFACCAGLQRSYGQEGSGGGLRVRVVDVIWGFDGRVSAGHFQPLSLLLDNLSGDVLEGTISIRLAGSPGRDGGGGVLQQPIFLGAASRRWVQFYPYVPAVPESWEVRLATEFEAATLQRLNPPRLAIDPAKGRLMRGVRASDSGEAAVNQLPAVFLSPARNMDRFPTSVRHMPAEIFPPYATATGGLHAIFLDHVPDWEEPRQRAFLWWLSGGGQLHVLRDTTGRELQFQGVLSVLNEPIPEFPVGQGRVFREGVQRRELSEERVNAVIRVASESEDFRDERNQRPLQSSFGTEWWDFVNDEDLFGALRELVEPRHEWLLIGLLSFVYIGALYPGIWRFSAATGHSPLKTMAAVLGLSAIFSAMFLWLGRRGYGEVESMRTLMVAAAVDDKSWDCLQFSQLFATDGGMYEVKTEDQDALISAGSRLEPSEAVIQSGNTASVRAKLAPYSLERLTIRRRLELPDWEAVVEDWKQQAGEVTSLRIRLGADFPFGGQPFCLALAGQRVFRLRLDAVSRTAELMGAGTWVEEWLRPQTEDVTVFGMAFPSEEDPELVRERELRGLLMRRCFGLREEYVREVRAATGSVVLLVEADLPEGLSVRTDPEVPESGRVMFMKTLSVDGSAGR